MSNKIKLIIGILILLLAIGTVSALWFMNNSYDVIEEFGEAKALAHQMHEEGDINGAIELLETYCQHIVTDIESRAILGDWYLETGDEEEALEQYKTAAKNKMRLDEKIETLSIKNKSEILLEPVRRVVLEITPDVRLTKDMTLFITNHNLTPDVKVNGGIVAEQETLEETERYITTDWFEVDPDGDYLTMSGGFNAAVWQFKNVDGEIIVTSVSKNNYREKNTVSVNVYQMARVIIPDEAAYCRVTYFDRTKEEKTASTDEELTIVYGRLPGESRKADFSYYQIPDLHEGEKIVFDSVSWKLITEDTETVLDWKIPTVERGSYISVGGVLPGRVSFEKCEYAQYEKDGIYTIRFDTENPSAMGERMDDATNLGFNASVAEGYIALGENHFDNIYPWSEMKLCVIKDGRISYPEAGGLTADENEDVFVEIPKFYYKRVYDGRYDTISISGKMHEGFRLDEAFITENGEADKLYIATYITSQDEENNLRSVADALPAMSVSAKKMDELIKSKGEGYCEIDYSALSALQKLFMVETGLRNSQYLLMGVCSLSIASDNPDSETFAVATTDAEKTNCIVVNTNYEFNQGDSVVIFNRTDYASSIKAAVADARKVTVSINNNDGTKSVYFSGEPVNIQKDTSAIAHIGTASGTTLKVKGHTGAMSTARGKVSFKYRNIENLWGNTHVYIGGVRIKNSAVTLTDRRGQKETLSYKIPNVVSHNVADNIIKKIGYDASNPSVMLPEVIGDGATISTYYGDCSMRPFTENPDREYVLYYGGGWNSMATAGLFSYSIMATEEEGHIDASGRMMYIPEN